MPFGIHKHNNRSKQALNDPIQGDTSGGPSRSDSSREDFDDTQTQVFTTPRPESYAQGPAPAHDPHLQQQKLADSPSRSQSTRYPGPYPPQALQPHPGGSAVDLSLDPRYQQQGGPYTPHPPVVEPVKKSKGFFDRMRSGGSRTEPKPPPPSQPSYNNTAGLARRQSKKEKAPAIRPGQQRESVEVQKLDWQPAQESRPSPHEGQGDDSELDPYLIRGDEQEAPQSVSDQTQHPTIRAVQGEPEVPPYPAIDEQRQQFEVQQQHLREQSHQQHLDSQQYYQSQQQTQPQHHVNISRSSLVIGDSYSHQNPETVSQLSFESPVEQREEQRPVSVQSNGQSPTNYSTPRQQGFPNRTSSISLQPEVQHPPPQFDSMPPPPGGNAAGRRTADNKPTSSQGQGQGQGQQESRDGPPPNYSRGQFPNNQPPTPGLSPIPPAGGTQPQAYRGGPPQRDQFNAQGEQGRSTPPPAPNTQDISDNYKELLTKYKKVKGLYFEKTAQVEQLQNTLANQRLSQSRTSLDDSEYMTRFQRLEGAITNLAFNIRKDWRSVPVWLSPWVNQDALRIGKQEMTAVGRACITKFLVDEIFNRTFHPGLESELSLHLKTIEHNIRLFSPALNNQEESEALTAKVVQWRLATLEGLKDVLMSPESDEYKKQFARVATTNLTASLINFLQEPIPAGIEDSAHMIVELAVNIASNLPLESRDISIIHPMPGDMLQPVIMKVENPIAALENPGADTDDAESTNSGDKDSEKEEKEGGKLRKGEKKTPGMLQAMMGANNNAGKKPSEGVEKKMNAEDGAQKVRFAGFVGVEVRGRQVLVKAPIWTVS